MAATKATEFHTARQRVIASLRALFLAHPVVPLSKRCDVACAGAIVSQHDDGRGVVERCDECERFETDTEAEAFVTLLLQANALGITPEEWS